MKISTKGRYALRMLLDLAEHQADGFISLKEIASRQKISKKYLEQIVPILNKSDLLKTTRGFQGGYQLAKSPDHCTVGEIFRLTEGDLRPIPMDYSEIANGPGNEPATLPVWKGLDRIINEYLDSVTLQDLLDQQRERYTHDYVI
ncbi:MAG: Rrf2 family transcriptional regulator [Oscillospiraceae bacterium]|nr:Rrf2 family transcriptional regulator [Oscillospiraceae bacterium]